MKSDCDWAESLSLSKNKSTSFVECREDHGEIIISCYILSTISSYVQWLAFVPYGSTEYRLLEDPLPNSYTHAYILGERMMMCANLHNFTDGRVAGTGPVEMHTTTPSKAYFTLDCFSSFLLVTTCRGSTDNRTITQQRQRQGRWRITGVGQRTDTACQMLRHAQLIMFLPTHMANHLETKCIQRSPLLKTWIMSVKSTTL